MPIDVELAREAIAAVEAEGFHPNVYVDDELYVSHLTEHAEAYASFQGLDIHVVGDVGAWLDRPPTKVVCVGDPDVLDGLELRMKERLRRPADDLEVAAVLPRVRRARDHEGLGARLPRRADGLHAPSRRSRSATARTTSSWSSGPATGSRSRTRTPRVKAVADWICPPAADEGVASVLEALLDSRA